MIELGDKVKDPITGFKGTAVARSTYLYGCVRISVQGPVDKDGNVPEWVHFDEPQLENIKPKKAKKKADHGPRPAAKLNLDASRR